MRTDIKETEHAYLLEVDMPGFSKEHIQVEYHDGVLTISAQMDEARKETDYQMIRQERHEGRMSRSYRLDGIDEDQIQAVYRDGVLRLLMPKSSENSNYRKRIDVQ
ncbi:MAG TPA: Hsp20/alpha crystallin family protein [Syntrophomonadaceae bacterium]|nr:Hsp20/alpha crystallin family protein [Syntrophomonadaceae bacterium]